MKQVHLPAARQYAPGIGDAVANRTVNRKIVAEYQRPITVNKTFKRVDGHALSAVVDEWCRSEGFKYAPEFTVSKGDGSTVSVQIEVTGSERFETWEEVCARVALGNALLEPFLENRGSEELKSLHHLRQASVLMSGRHLQHGDETQPARPMEVMTNCSTSSTSFITFYLLLNGSGVGRAYDDDLMVVDWTKMPIVVPTISQGHPDVLAGLIAAVDSPTARHLYKNRDIIEFMVPDSREGWALAVEQVEALAYQKDFSDTVLLLNFSDVRPKGAPIMGMQGRPSSGPGPLMNALNRIAALRQSNMKPWRAAMFVDHYLAECVLVGGARRAARMSTKNWLDEDVMEFCEIKRGGMLWTSNNSVTVDDRFWAECKTEGLWSAQLLETIASCAYHDGTGEPGIINQHRLVKNPAGMDSYKDGAVLNPDRLPLLPPTVKMYAELASKLEDRPYVMITNPCGEIPLLTLAGYCVIGDVVPFHAQNDDDAEDAFRTCTRMLIRTNLMDALYDREVARTNRIGVGMTGLHEYAYARFGYGFRDLIEEGTSQDFWHMLSRFKRAIVDEAKSYSEWIGVEVPHTNTTIKPAGTTSKLFGLTEGAHLPSMREYLRYVQFRNDDPLVAHYESLGYPVMRLQTYEGTTVVGFPTRPLICSMGMGDKLVTASEATPEEQYLWLQLLEKYWIIGVDEEGNPLEDTGNQVSYTLKLNPALVSYESFKATLIEGQSQIKCCAVQPVGDEALNAYEYMPETPITEEQYHELCAELARRNEGDQAVEMVDYEHLQCASGVCPL